MLAWLLAVWKAYAHRAATYQTSVLLTLVYAIILGPAALVARALGARLLEMDPPGANRTTTWTARANEAEDKTLAALRRQF